VFKANAAKVVIVRSVLQEADQKRERERERESEREDEPMFVISLLVCRASYTHTNRRARKYSL